ncbi:hypothetical protein [Tropicimonas sp. S265A]|uniref:hypothetical protein n=1 Tax=Tropicimonas sp. S265A TaxID=3415134 RepID=UPI003C798425
MTPLRLLAPVIAAIACALPAAAQSPVAQAGAHVQFALTECLRNYRTPEQLHDIFTQAGMGHSIEDFGGGEIIHWYDAPDQTAFVAVVGLGGANGPECRITTNHISVTAMLPFARSVAARVMSGVTIADTSPEGQVILPDGPGSDGEFCTGFHMLVPRSMIWVQVGNPGNEAYCRSSLEGAIIRVLL